VINNYLTLFNI